MKNKILALALSLFMTAPVFADTIGSIRYSEVFQNYSKAKAALSEMEDRRNELQLFILNKEQEFKKIDSPVKKKSFEDATAKELAQKQEAFQKFQIKKEKEIDDAIVAAVKAVALENKVDTVIEAKTIYFGAVDLTPLVIKKLNTGN